ncbi:MAG TPA: hypothetical protein VN728_15575 [Stellaceae bacterium]|jgi:hypothetical protein|nr:hypothetical protein [Stellaceae bacterium]
MIDASENKLQLAAGLSPETLRARARCRRETAERLWDERLEQLLIEEAEELERRAAALEVDAAIKVEKANLAGKVVQPDLAALREDVTLR